MWTKVFNGYFVGEIKFSPSGQIGYAIHTLSDSIPYPINVLKTTDGGSSWNLCFVPPDSIFFSPLYVKSDDEVFGIFSGSIVGRQAQLYRSTNGGFNWDMVFETMDYACRGVVGDNQGNIFLATSNFWSSPDLINWQSREDPLTFCFGEPKYANNKVYLSGCSWVNNNSYPAIAFTTDQGISWTNAVLQDSGQCHNIDFAPNGVGYAIGSVRGTNMRWMSNSFDQGLSWPQHYSTDQVEFNDLCASSRYVYIACSIFHGAGAVVIRYDPTITGQNNPEQEIPGEFKLNQNYPNPFNPTTQITYKVSERSYVMLNVYDITGRKVKELVSEEQNPGAYKVHFNAQAFSSGTYFYRLQTDSYSETKKMILVK